MFIKSKIASSHLKIEHSFHLVHVHIIYSYIWRGTDIPNVRLVWYSNQLNTVWSWSLKVLTPSGKPNPYSLNEVEKQVHTKTHVHLQFACASPHLDGPIPHLLLHSLSHLSDNITLNHPFTFWICRVEYLFFWYLWTNKKRSWFWMISNNFIIMITCKY